MSDHGLELLMQWEGFRTMPYADVGNKLTIGVGHLLTATELASKTISIGGQSIEWQGGLTDQQVMDLLRQDVAIYEADVNRTVTVPLEQCQFDALTSFTFNEGTGAFDSSTLLKDINGANFSDVPAQLRRWNKVNGKVVKGLTNRRANEIRLWNGELPASQRSYTVKAGDTLESVATRFKTTVGDIAHVNNIINPADFRPGRVVHLP